MKRITKITTESTDISESLKWAEIDSKISSLLKETDHIFLEDSDVINKNEWKQWRDSVRKIKKNCDNKYGKAVSLLRNIEENRPKLITLDLEVDSDEIYVTQYPNIMAYKLAIISSVKRKYTLLVLQRLIESGTDAVFSILRNEKSDDINLIVDQAYNDMQEIIKEIETSEDIKKLTILMKKYNGYRY